MPVRAKLAEANKQLAERDADKRRLDWLDTDEGRLVKMSAGWNAWPTKADKYWEAIKPTARAAIDAALAREAKTTEERT